MVPFNMDFILTEAAFDSQFRRESGVVWLDGFGDGALIQRELFRLLDDNRKNLSPMAS